ncbi:MAG: VCBS repeat-containing protein [Chloroflexota bacterium]
MDKKWRINKFYWVISIVLAVSMLMMCITPVVATPPISGTSIVFGNKNDVEQGTNHVNAIVFSDLDNDGDLDLISGSNTGNHELSARQNDGSPFSGTWSDNDLRDSTATVPAVAVGDLDKDGNPDVVSGDANNNVIIWQNDGSPFSGTWSVSQIIGSGAGDIQSLLVVDVDRDGDQDIVSGSDKDSGVIYELIVWENPWTPADTNPFDQAWTGHNIQNIAENINSLAFCDLDSDGWLDIVVGYQDVSGDEVTAWENNYDSSVWTFTERSVGSHPGGGSVYSVACGDIDRDGDFDLISGASSGSDVEIVVWEATGGWSFVRRNVGTGDGVESLVLADLNNNGYLDIAVVTDAGGASGDGKLTVWENNAETTFDWSFTEIAIGTETGKGLRVVAVGDLDNDGDTDIATGREEGSSYEVAVWPNTLVHRNAYFLGGMNISSSSDDSRTVVAGDLNNDGKKDLVIGRDSAVNTVWMSNGDGTFTQVNNPGWSGSTNTRALVLGDLNNDGKFDLVIGLDGAADTVWLGNGDGTFTQVESPGWSGATDTRALALGDLNQDGRSDLVIGIDNGADTVWLGDGDGTFTQEASPGWSGSTNTRALALGDLNNDGTLDLVVGIHGDVDTVWTGDGDGTFTQVMSPGWSGSSDTPALATGDLNNDRKLDLVVGLDGAEDTVWLGDGDGTFTQVGSPGWSGATNTRCLSLGDLDLDGKLDLVVNIYGNTDTVWMGDGDGTFTQVNMSSWSATNTNASVLGDFDGDADPDLVSVFTSARDQYFKNIGGNAELDVTDTSSASFICDGCEDDVLKVVFDHNGIFGDHDLELNRFDLDLLASDCSTALTTAQANQYIANLRVRLDDGDNTFETTDTIVGDIASGAFSLDANGVQTVSFTDDDSNVQVSIGGTASKIYWISLKAADGQGQLGVCVRFDPDADALVEGKSPDFSVSIQDTDPTQTGNVPTAITLLNFGVQSSQDLTDFRSLSNLFILALVGLVMVFAIYFSKRKA